ncbi:unnamed protein product, partial [marine sediment metagenome]
QRDLSADSGRAKNGGRFSVNLRQGIKKPVDPDNE